MKRQKTSRFPFWIICLGFLFIGGISLKTYALRTLRMGDTIKDYELTLFSDKTTRNISDLTGEKGLLIIFWATWSDRSLRLLTFAETDLKQKYEKEGIKIVGINVDGQDISDEEMRKMEPVVKDLKLSFPLAINHGLVMFDEIGIITNPTTVLIDKNLTLEDSYPGFPTNARYDIPEMMNDFLGIEEELPPLRVRYLLEHQPKNRALLSYNYGKTVYKRYLSMKGELKRAPADSLKQLDRANERDPDFYAPYLLKAIIFHKANEVEMKYDVLDQIAEKNFQEHLEMVDLAYMYLLIGMRDKSKEMLSALKEDIPEEKEVNLLEALILVSDRDNDKAAEIFTELIEKENTRKDFSFDLSEYIDGGTGRLKGEPEMTSRLLAEKILNISKK